MSAKDSHAVPSGSVWAVHVQPQFAEQVYEAAQLLTRPPAAQPTSGPAKASPPTEFALGLRQKALAAAPSPQQQTSAEVDGEAEEEEPAAERPQPKADTEEVKEKKRKVVEELFTKVRPGCFGRADDRELDAVNNLLIALLVGTFPPSQVRPFASELLEALSAAEGRVTPYGRYSALVTLFNASPAPAPSDSTEVPLQLTILLRLASLGASHPDDLSLVAPSLLRLPSYLSTWSLASSSTGASAVEKVAAVLSQNDRPSDAFALVLDYLRTPGAIPDPVAATAVKLALTSPDFFDWRAVESIEPVKSYLSSTSSGAHAQLLRALDDGNVAQVEKTLAGSADFGEQEKETVVKKAKLLSLAELCGKRVGGQVTYDEVAEALGLQGSIDDDDGMQVEEWIINAIKAHLISARVHQPTRVISVTTATSRSFGQQQWTQLLSRLRTWSSSLDSLVASVERSLPAGAKAGAAGAGKEKVLEEKEKDARAVKEQVVGQVKSEVETVA